MVMSGTARCQTLRGVECWQFWLNVGNFGGPRVFEWIVQVPLFRQSGTILLQLFGGELAMLGVTSLNPRSGSLRAPRKEAVTSDKMWGFNAANKLLYEVTLLRAAA